MEITKQYKVGDYLTGEDLVFFRVATVVKNESNNPIYGLFTVKGASLQWMTQFELDRQGILPKKPKFEAFKKAKAGDIIAVGRDNEKGGPTEYRTILARVNDVMLISSGGHRAARMMLDVDEFFAEQTDGQHILSETQKREAEFAKHRANTSKSAGDWYTSEVMALMNWELLSETEGE